VLLFGLVGLLEIWATWLAIWLADVAACCSQYWYSNRKTGSKVDL